MATSLKQTSSLWSSELEKIHRDLTDASIAIQNSFAQSSSNLNNSVAPADPIKILQRIHALESTIQKLDSECQHYVRRRPVLAEEVTSLLLKNFNDIEELTVLAKGKKASHQLDPKLKRLAIATHGEHLSWKKCLEKNRRHRGYQHPYDNEDGDSDHTTKSVVPLPDDSTNAGSSIDDSSSTDINGTSYIDEETGNIKITHEQFESIPTDRRKRCKLDHVQRVASFIYQETSARYLEGYRGKNLAVERHQIAKYSGAHPGLYAVIMNHSLWRDIVSSLRFLGFVRVDKDGTLIMTGLH